MNFQLNGYLGNWLSQLNGKRIDKIFQVDFNEGRNEDIYLPWLFFITFYDFEMFLEIEGDFNGSHIKINLFEISKLDKKIKSNNLSEESYCWRVYDTEKVEVLGKLIGQKIEFIEYGIDKNEFEINGILCKGEKEFFNFIRFNCEEISITIFEGSATGLGVSDDINCKLELEETFETFNTK